MDTNKTPSDTNLLRPEHPDPSVANTAFCPLTPMERGMYLEQVMEPDATAYNLNLGIFIEGAEEAHVPGGQA